LRFLKIFPATDQTQSKDKKEIGCGPVASSIEVSEIHPFAPNDGGRTANEEQHAVKCFVSTGRALAMATREPTSCWRLGHFRFVTELSCKFAMAASVHLDTRSIRKMRRGTNAVPE
jgi:hypothetical protein